jgi:hypothetical protein
MLSNRNISMTRGVDLKTNHVQKFNLGLNISKTKTISPTCQSITQKGTRYKHDRKDTSPVKVRYVEDEGDDDQDTAEGISNEKTVAKRFNLSSAFDNKENKENLFHSINTELFLNKCNRFSSNVNAKNQMKTLISCGKLNESKPSLNATESRNKLVSFSKSKNYNELKYFSSDDDSSVVSSISYLSKDTSNFGSSCRTYITTATPNENKESTEEKDSEEEAYLKLLEEQEKKLPVPIEKKNDERFKLFKMKEMKRKSAPPNKSARAWGDLVPDYKRDYQNGNIKIYINKTFTST